MLVEHGPAEITALSTAPIGALEGKTDDHLVELAHQGREEAYTMIVQRHRQEMLRLARRLSSDGSAEDIVQQALLSAYAALGAGTPVRHLRAWLCQIVRNCAAKSHRPFHAPLEYSDACGQDLEDLVQQRDEVRRALELLERLPRRQRQALVSTALQGRARAAIAADLGVSEGSVRQLVHRARLTLRDAVAALVPYPLLRALAPARELPPPASDLALSAGAATAGGLIVKAGTVIVATVAVAGLAHPDGARPIRAPRPLPKAAVAQARPVSAAARSFSVAPARHTLAAATVLSTTVHRGQGRSAHRAGGSDGRSGPGRRDGGSGGGESGGPSSPQAQSPGDGSSHRSGGSDSSGSSGSSGGSDSSGSSGSSSGSDSSGGLVSTGGSDSSGGLVSTSGSDSSGGLVSTSGSDSSGGSGSSGGSDSSGGLAPPVVAPTSSGGPGPSGVTGGASDGS